MKSWIGFGLTVLLLAGWGFLEMTRTASAASVVVTVPAAADTYVQGSSGANTNFGSQPTIALRGDRYRDGYLRFDLTGLEGSVSSAKLLLSGGPAEPATSVAFVGDDSWNEATITNNTRPSSSGSGIAGIRPDPAGPVEFDVTALARTEQDGDGQLSLLLYSTLGGTTAYSFDARDKTTGVVPRLVVTVDTTVMIAPEADAYVQRFSGADTNYGSMTKIALRGDRYRDGYIRFNLAAATHAIASARVWLEGGLTPDPATSVAFVSDDSWNEANVTYNTRPGSGADVATGTRLPAGGPVEFDVSEQARIEQAGDDKLSLLLYSTLGNTTSYDFTSKEAITGTAPRLVVERTAPEVRLTPEAVASTQAGSQKDSNYPGVIRTKYNNKFGYVRYDLSGISGLVTKATFRLEGGADMVKAAFVPDDTWSETAITYNTAPPAGPDIATGHYGTADSVEFDVTSQVQMEMVGNKQLSLRIFTTATDGNNYVYGSQPELVLTVLYDPVVTDVSIAPEIRYSEAAVAIPLSGSVATRFAAQVADQNGGVMAGETVAWSVIDSPSGVSIGSDGTLTVTNGAVAGVITLQAVADTDHAVLGTLDVTLLASVPNPDAHPYAFYDTGDLPALANKIASEPFLGWYNTKKTVADRYTLTQLDDIAAMNPWRTFTSTFQAPAGAATAELSLRLRGQGSVRFDRTQLVHIGFDYVPIANSGFESGTGWPDDWAHTVYGGSPLFTYATGADPDHVSEGTDSVAITNGADADEGGWDTTSPIAVVAGDMYSLQVDISQEQELAEGVYLYVTFRDAVGNEVGEPVRSLRFNRQTPGKRAGLGLGEDALAYAMTGDADYAEKAVKVLQYTLDDMRAGMQYFLATGQDPDQTSQAVHIGRALGTVAIAYDMIADAGVWTANEDNDIRAKFYWIADKLMDRSYYDYEADGVKRSNFNSDRAAGLGIFAIVFPEYARSADYLAHAVSQIEWQLANVVGADGGWPETIRYQQAVMDRWISFATMLKRQGGTDLMSNAAFKQMFAFLIEVQTPRDTASTLAPGLATYPAIGDHTWREAIQILGLGASYYASSDATFSKQMMYGWNRTGSDIRAYYPIAALTLIDPGLPEQKPALGSMAFDDMGYVLFRENYDEPDENYMIIVGGNPQLSSHQHADRGSFSLYADSTPLSLDPGVSGYGTGINPNWFQASPSHNVVQFKDNTGAYRTSPQSSVIENVYFSAGLDYTRIAIPDSLAASHKRHIAYVKQPLQAYVVWDAIDSAYESRIHFHTLSVTTDVYGAQATAHGYNDKDLELTFAMPQSVTIAKSVGALAEGFYSQNVQEHLTVDAAAGEDFLTILYPKNSADSGLTVTVLAVGQSDAAAYRVSDANGAWFVVVANRAAAAQEIGIDIGNSLRDLQSGTLYTNDSGSTAVSAEGGAIRFLMAAE